MHAEQQRDHGHKQQRPQAAAGLCLLHEGMAAVDRGQQQAQVQPVTGRQQQRATADPAAELGKGDDRAREGERADQHADINLDLVDDFFDLGRETNAVVHEVHIADQHRRQPDQAMQYRDQFRHLGHLNLSGQGQADRAADQHHYNNDRDIIGDFRPGDGGEDGDRHADDAVDIAPARGFLMTQAAERQDE